MFYYRVSWFDWKSGGNLAKSDGFVSFFEAYQFCKAEWDEMTVEDRVSTFLVEHVNSETGKVVEAVDLSIRQIEGDEMW